MEKEKMIEKSLAFSYGMKKEIEAIIDKPISDDDFRKFMDDKYFELVPYIEEAWEEFKEEQDGYLNE